MPETLSCPHCDDRLKLPAGAKGEEVECPSCGASFPHPGQKDDGAVPDSDGSEPDGAQIRGKQQRETSLTDWVVVTLFGTVILGGLVALGVGGYFFWSEKQSNPPEVEWTTFSPPDRRFTVSMPAVPLAKPMVINGVTAQQYVHEDVIADVLFTVAYVDLPASPPPANLVAKAAAAERDELLKKIPGATLSREFDLSTPYTGREIQVKLPGGAGTLIDRVLLVKTAAGTRLYVVAACGGRQPSAAKDAARFFDSFKPVDPPGTPIQPVGVPVVPQKGRPPRQ